MINVHVIGLNGSEPSFAASKRIAELKEAGIEVKDAKELQELDMPRLSETDIPIKSFPRDCLKELPKPRSKYHK